MSDYLQEGQAEAIQNHENANARNIKQGEPDTGYIKVKISLLQAVEAHRVARG
jgi:hypothetical protein